LYGTVEKMASPFTLSHLPISSKTDENIGAIVPSFVGAMFIKIFPPQL
jgi:hypothetical protein